MKKKLCILITIFLFIISSHSLTIGKKILKFEGIDGSYGMDFYEDALGNRENFYKFQFKPLFKLGKTKIGLDLQYFVDEDGKLNDGTYDDDGDFLDKIDFIEQNNKNSKRYWRLGFLEDISFGNSSIINNYSNNIRYPEKVKRTGFYGHLKNQFDDGLQIMINDIDSAKIIAFRGFIVPIDDVVLGGTLVIDKDPDANPATSDDLQIYGVDFTTPLFRGMSNKLLLFEDFTRIQHHGDCFTSGIKYNSGFRSKFRLEYRIYDSNFIPGYINSVYETEKADRYKDLLHFSSVGISTVKSINFQFQYNLLDIFDVKAEFEDFNSYSIEPTLKINAKLLKSPISGFDLNIEYLNKDADLRDYITGVRAKNVYITTTVKMQTKTGANITMENKRIVNEAGDVEHITTFTTGLSLK